MLPLISLPLGTRIYSCDMAGYNFKDEKEVQEYLKNLHIEYQFGCLSEKKPEGKVSLLTILTSSLQCFTFSGSVSSFGRLL